MQLQTFRPGPGRHPAGPCRAQRSLRASAQHATTLPVGTASTSSVAAAAGLNNIVELREYRRGVGLCVVNREGLVFAARRMDDKENTWQMPQGGIDRWADGRYENPMTAALRELKEETGIINARIVASIDPWLQYDFPTKVRAQLSGGWVRYRGQTQKWYLVEFLGSDCEIDLSCHGEPEFSEFRWMPLEGLPDSVVGFKQNVYKSVAQHFGPVIRQRYSQQQQAVTAVVAQPRPQAA